MTERGPSTGKTASKRTDSPTKTRADRARTKREPPAKKPPARPDLTILETQVFRGPNFWTYEPAIRMLVDLGSLEHWPSNTIKRCKSACTVPSSRLGGRTCARASGETIAAVLSGRPPSRNG